MCAFCLKDNFKGTNTVTTFTVTDTPNSSPTNSGVPSANPSLTNEVQGKPNTNWQQQSIPPAASNDPLQSSSTIALENDTDLKTETPQQASSLQPTVQIGNKRPIDKADVIAIGFDHASTHDQSDQDLETASFKFICQQVKQKILELQERAPKARVVIGLEGICNKDNRERHEKFNSLSMSRLEARDSAELPENMNKQDFLACFGTKWGDKLYEGLAAEGLLQRVDVFALGFSASMNDMVGQDMMVQENSPNLPPVTPPASKLDLLNSKLSADKKPNPDKDLKADLLLEAELDQNLDDSDNDSELSAPTTPRKKNVSPLMGFGTKQDDASPLQGLITRQNEAHLSDDQDNDQINTLGQLNDTWLDDDFDENASDSNRTASMSGVSSLQQNDPSPLGGLHQVRDSVLLSDDEDQGPSADIIKFQKGLMQKLHVSQMEKKEALANEMLINHLGMISAANVQQSLQTLAGNDQQIAEPQLSEHLYGSDDLKAVLDKQGASDSIPNNNVLFVCAGKDHIRTAPPKDIQVAEKTRYRESGDRKYSPNCWQLAAHVREVRSMVVVADLDSNLSHYSSADTETGVWTNNPNLSPNQSGASEQIVQVSDQTIKTNVYSFTNNAPLADDGPFMDLPETPSPSGANQAQTTVLLQQMSQKNKEPEEVEFPVSIEQDHVSVYHDTTLDYLTGIVSEESFGLPDDAGTDQKNLQRTEHFSTFDSLFDAETVGN